MAIFYDSVAKPDRDVFEGVWRRARLSGKAGWQRGVAGKVGWQTGWDGWQGRVQGRAAGRVGWWAGWSGR